MTLEPIDKKLITIVGCLLVLLFVGMALTGNLSRESSNRFEAQVACENQIEESLIAPKDSEITTLKFAQSETTPTNWRFWGSVTASNSFGAFLTKHWTCTYSDGFANASIDE